MSNTVREMSQQAPKSLPSSRSPSPSKRKKTVSIPRQPRRLSELQSKAMALSDQPRASPSKQIMHLMYYFLLQRVTVDDLLQDKSSLYKSNCFRWCD